MTTLTPTSRPPTTTDDDHSYADKSTRRKILTKTRRSSKLPEIEVFQSAEDSATPESNIERRFYQDSSTQTDAKATTMPTKCEEWTVTEEVQFLRRMVQKLNVELSKGLSVNCVDILEGQTAPSWLHDLRHLAPLVMAFEEEVPEANSLKIKFWPSKDTS